MDATVILIDSDAELARARALVDRLWDSNEPADIARLEAQARLIAAYEERKWPRRPPRIADLIRHLMDQHGLTRADMVPILGTPSRVSEVLRGKKGLSMTMVQRLRARFRVPADRGARRAPEWPARPRMRSLAARVPMNFTSTRPNVNDTWTTNRYLLLLRSKMTRLSPTKSTVVPNCRFISAGFAQSALAAIAGHARIGPSACG